MVLNLCCAHSLMLPGMYPAGVSSFLVVLAMRSFAFASRMDAKENSDDIASSAEWVHSRRHASITMTRRNLRIVFGIWLATSEPISAMAFAEQQF